MHAESRYAALPFDARKVSESLLKMTQMDAFCVLVAGDPVLGMIIAFCEEIWWSSAKESWDMVFYVKPQARGSSAAARLLKAYVAWAKRRGVQEIKIGFGTAVREDATASFYGKMGFERLFSGFVLREKALCAVAA